MRRRSRGRPRQYETEFKLGLDSALLDAARFRANAQDISIAEFVRRAIRDALDREPVMTGGRNAR
jgi:predicted HicB family RNase H-like nuclease